MRVRTNGLHRARELIRYLLDDLHEIVRDGGYSAVCAVRRRWTAIRGHRR
jgi:hypothetical protein